MATWYGECNNHQNCSGPRIFSRVTCEMLEREGVLEPKLPPGRRFIEALPRQGTSGSSLL